MFRLSTTPTSAPDQADYTYENKTGDRTGVTYRDGKTGTVTASAYGYTGTDAYTSVAGPHAHHRVRDHVDLDVRLRQRRPADHPDRSITLDEHADRVEPAG